MKIFVFLFLVFSQFCIPILVQADTVKDSRLWLTYTAEHLLNEDWKVIMQLQPYWRDEGHAFDQVTFRTGIYYRVNPQMMLGGGYAFAEGFQPNHQRTHENRLWEEINYQFDKLSFVNLSLRTRFEHRHFEHKGEVLHSIRQMIKISSPLTNTIGLLISDEAYVNINETERAPRGADQNRLFVGLSYSVMPASIMEFGYINQYVTRIGDDAENHILALSLSQSF